MVAYFVDSPGDEKPPADCTTANTNKKEKIEDPVIVGSNEDKACTRKQHQEEEDDGGIAHGKAKA